MGGLSQSTEKTSMDLTRKNLLETTDSSNSGSNASQPEKVETMEKTSDRSWSNWFSDEEKYIQNSTSVQPETKGQRQNWTYEASKEDNEDTSVYQKYHTNLPDDEPQTKKYASTEDFVRDYKDKWQLKWQSLLEQEEQQTLQKKRAEENSRQQEESYQQLKDDKTFARRKEEEHSFIRQRLKEQFNPYEKQAFRPAKMEEELTNRLSPSDNFAENFHKSYNLKRKNLLEHDIRYAVDENYGRQKVADNLFDRINPIISKFEGTTLYPYVDTKGYRTIGTGKNIQGKKVAAQVNFVDVNGKPISLEKAWRQMQPLAAFKSGHNHLAEYFENLTPVRITPEERNRLLKEHIMSDVNELRQKIKNFDNLHPNFQDVLLDLQYNLGGTEFSEEKWPKLFERIDKNNYVEIPNQLHRKNEKTEERNQWAKEHAQKAVDELKQNR